MYMSYEIMLLILLTSLYVVY